MKSADNLIASLLTANGINDALNKTTNKITSGWFTL